MLYTENLEEIIFNRHEMHETDELVIISGYLGPKPVERLGELPFPTKVIYGMYGAEGVKDRLHKSLIHYQAEIDNLNIFYSTLPVHSKCYIWKNRGNISHALIGSANFSVNGLTTPFREVLAETTRDTFLPLNKYTQLVLNNCISCLEAHPTQQEARLSTTENFTENIICSASLLAKNGEVQNAAGLNWGQNPKNHTNPNDAYIPIRTNDIKKNPLLFPPKQEKPKSLEGGGRRTRHNDFIEIIWDDGLVMRGLLEGTQPIGENGIIYPKQISSAPSKSELGLYLRERLGVPSGQPVRAHHLRAYGRDSIDISLLEEGVYQFDFSV